MTARVRAARVPSMYCTAAFDLQLNTRDSFLYAAVYNNMYCMQEGSGVARVSPAPASRLSRAPATGARGSGTS